MILSLIVNYIYRETNAEKYHNKLQPTKDKRWCEILLWNTERTFNFKLQGPKYVLAKIIGGEKKIKRSDVGRI